MGRKSYMLMGVINYYRLMWDWVEICARETTSSTLSAKMVRIVRMRMSEMHPPVLLRYSLVELKDRVKL